MKLEKEDKKSRRFKKTLRAIGYSLMGVLLFLYIIIALLNTSFFQSLIANKLSEHFSKEWGVEFRLSAVNINIFDRIELHDVYLEDNNGDTILFSDNIHIKLNGFPTSKGIKIARVIVQNTVFNLGIDEDGINFRFIIDYFASDKPKEKKDTEIDFVVDIEQVKLENLSFSLMLKDSPGEYADNVVAINNMRFREIDGDLRNVRVIGDSILLSFNEFSAYEHSGMNVERLEGDFIVSPKMISTKNTRIKTKDSEIMFDVEMFSDSWMTYADFIDSVYIRAEIHRGSRVGMRDATYWAEALDGFYEEGMISGRFTGRVADLYCQDLELEMGGLTRLRADGFVKGLPYPENTVYDLNIKEFQTSYQDYRSMSLGFLIGGLPIPDMLNSLGRIRFSGSFKGLIDDFAAKGDFHTNIGSLRVDGIAKSIDGSTGYRAKLYSRDFDAGKVLDLDFIRTREINVDAFVSGSSLDNLRAELVGGLGNIDLLENNYDTVFINAGMENKEVNANFYINDNSINMDGIATLYLDDEIGLSLESNIRNADLREMNLIGFSDTNTLVSALMFAELSSLDIESLAGRVRLRDIELKLSEEDYEVDYIDINLSNNNDVNSLIINSDLLDLSLIGSYNLIGLGEDVSNIISHYIPSFEKENDSILILKQEIFYDSISEFELSASLKNAEPIMALFAPDIHISKNTFVYSKLSKAEKFRLSIGAKQIYIAGLSLFDINLDSRVKDEALHTYLHSSQFNLSDSLFLKDLSLSLMTLNDKLDLTLGFDDKKEINPTQGHLNFKSIIVNGILQGGFKNSMIELSGYKGFINNEHAIGFDGNKFAILNFELFREKEKININGILSDSQDDEIGVVFNNLDISGFNSLLKGMGLELEGRVNQSIMVRSALGSPSITCDLIIDSLGVNDNYLGRASFDIINIKDEFLVDISILYRGNKGNQNMPLSIKGSVFPEDSVDNLDLVIDLKDFNLGIIKPYLTSFSNDFKGYLSSDNLRVSGSFLNPDIKGWLVCQDGEINIDMLNTKYYFNDSLEVDNKRFVFNKFKLYDINKKPFSLSGIIQHDRFENFELDLSVEADNIRILNTNLSTDQMYYGSAFASAKASLKGDLNFLEIDVDAKTERGTKLTVPISSKTSVTQGSYIEFVDKTVYQTKEDDYISKKLKEPESEMEYSINVNLNVSPDAIIELPLSFSNLKGDLTASGNGEIIIEIDSKGNLNMFGGVEIENGIFNIVLMNLVEKNFIIQKGGRVDWNGNPAEGVIDAEAIYKTKASLAPILGIDKYSKPVDVQSVIMLSGNMTNPKPNFDIRLPNTDEQTIDQLFMTIDKNDEKQMLEQTISLLVMRQFYASSGGVSEGFRDADLTASAFEVAFSQVSGMLTNMIKFVDVGVNYTPGSETYSDQLDLNFSKSIGRWELVGDFVFGGKDVEQAKGSGSFLGDISAEYKITENFRLKAFNRSNANDFTKHNITPYTQGVGLTYKRQYESYEEMFKSFRNALSFGSKKPKALETEDDINKQDE